MHASKLEIALLAIAASAVWACSDAAPPGPAAEDANEVVEVEELEEVQARATGVIWLEMLAEWSVIQEIGTNEQMTRELFEQLDRRVGRLDALAEEVFRSLEFESPQLVHLQRATLVLRASLMDLDDIAKAEIPGQLPEALFAASGQMWALQNYFPEGYLPGPPLPQPEGVQ